jgi:hypothetical protein
LQAHVDELGLQQLAPELLAVGDLVEAGALGLHEQAVDAHVVLSGDAGERLLDLLRRHGDLGLDGGALLELFVDELLDQPLVKLGDGGVALRAVRYLLHDLHEERLGAPAQIAEEDGALAHDRHDAFDHGGARGRGVAESGEHRRERDETGKRAQHFQSLMWSRSAMVTKVLRGQCR